MRRTGKIAAFAALVCGAALALAFAAAETGLYDASATSPHLALTYDIIHWIGTRSIARRARDARMPRLTDAEIAAGAQTFDRVCATCHGAPGRAPDAFAEGMNPWPPPLSQIGREWPLNRIFWATAHGVKMTGMPAFLYRMREPEIWAVAAFVKQLPALSVQDYRDRVANAVVREPSAVAVALERAAPDRERGRIALTQHGCAACHAIPGLPGGRDAQTGPPLAGIGARSTLVGQLANTDASLAFWIQHPDRVRPNDVMPDMGVDARSAADIVAYLRSLKTP